MNSALLNATPLNTVGGGSGTKITSFSIDAILAIQVSKETAIDALLMGQYLAEVGIDAVLQGASTKFVSIDGVLATPYRDMGAFYRAVGDGISVPIDPNKISSWSTYSRPANPVLHQIGINRQTGKIEYWNGTAWKNYDNSAV